MSVGLPANAVEAKATATLATCDCGTLSGEDSVMNVQGTGIAASVPTTGKRASRDLRVDLVRGVALLIIFSDHVRGNPVREFMPISLGFSDMAEWFVFLLGYVNGIRRARPLIRPVGHLLPWRGGEGTLGRCLKLYAAILLMQVLTVIILAVAHAGGIQSVSLADLMLPRSGIEPSLWTTLTLQCLLINSCVLALYLILIWIVPLAAVLLRSRPLATVAASVAVYISVQIWPSTLSLPSPWAEAFYFNPFAWQLPFVLGMACGAAGPSYKGFIPRSMLALFAAACGLEVAFLIKVDLWNPPFDVGIDKVTLAPLRLLHFYCVLIVGRFLLPRNFRFLQSAVLRPIVLCGQHSLVTYCTGGLLATIGTLLMAKYGSNPGWTIAIHMAGWTGCLLVAGLFAGKEKKELAVT